MSGIETSGTSAGTGVGGGASSSDGADPSVAGDEADVAAAGVPVAVASRVPLASDAVAEGAMPRDLLAMLADRNE